MTTGGDNTSGNHLCRGNNGHDANGTDNGGRANGVTGVTDDGIGRDGVTGIGTVDGCTCGNDIHDVKCIEHKEIKRPLGRNTLTTYGGEPIFRG